MSKKLQSLQYALQQLPSIGEKSATRLSYFLLENKNIIEQMNGALEHSKSIQKCQMCRNWSDDPYCDICQNSDRDQKKICITLNPSDQFMIEKLGIYKGKYFILHHLISPLDQMGPEEIGIQNLPSFFQKQPVNEVIFALPQSPEGKITTNYLMHQFRLVQPDVVFSNLAQGVPIGSDLELINAQTMVHAFESRKIITD